jgi:cytidylate kinase
MIITISGSPGSGKSTVSRMLARKLGLRHYSVGDFMRLIAEKRGVSLMELSKIAEDDPSVDRELDSMTKNLRGEDNLIIDARLGYHFLPQSVKVFLDVDEEEAARRVFNDLRPSERENMTLEKTLENLRERKRSEIKRYREYYSLNPYDMKNYDMVIDTSNLSVEKVVEMIMEFLEERKHSNK